MRNEAGILARAWRRADREQITWIMDLYLSLLKRINDLNYSVETIQEHFHLGDFAPPGEPDQETAAPREPTERDRTLDRMALIGPGACNPSTETSAQRAKRLFDQFQAGSSPVPEQPLSPESAAMLAKGLQDAREGRIVSFPPSSFQYEQDADGTIKQAPSFTKSVEPPEYVLSETEDHRCVATPTEGRGVSIGGQFRNEDGEWQSWQDEGSSLDAVETRRLMNALIQICTVEQ